MTSESFLLAVKGLDRELDAVDLERFPTLRTGHFADLKIDTGTLRVWRSRCTLRDKEREPAYVEFLVNGVWVDIKDHPEYEPRLRNPRVYQFASVPIGPRVCFMYLLRNEKIR